MTPICVLLLGLVAQDGAAYRYFEVPPAAPGSVLYAFREGDSNVGLATDYFAFLDMQKSILADDQKGIADLQRSGRVFAIPTGTAVKVLEYEKAVANPLKAADYEVRVLEGKHVGKKGRLFANTAGKRVAVPEKAAKKKRR